MLRRPRRALMGGVVRHGDGLEMPDLQFLARTRVKYRTDSLDNKQRFGRLIPLADRRSVVELRWSIEFQLVKSRGQVR